MFRPGKRARQGDRSAALLGIRADVAERLGHLSLAEPAPTGTIPSLTQIKLVVSNSSGTVYSLNETTRAQVQLKPASDTKGSLEVKILPPGDQSACTVYQTMANRAQILLCEVNTYACNWTSGSGQEFSAGPINGGAEDARLALLKLLCQQSQTLTQEEADANFQCAVAK